MIRQLLLFNLRLSGYTDVAKLLLDKGANPDLQNKGGLTALMAASLNGHIEYVKLLAEQGR